jgi:glucan phosphoethanolaminetransferase (alkaline phosphatase superfamily)
MSNSVYQINKGINKPIEFKGLKAQYIWYLGIGLVLLLFVFAIMYIAGLNIFICLVIIFSAGTALFMQVYKMSRTYGQYGLMKKVARKAVPKVIKSYSIVKLKKQLVK